MHHVSTDRKNSMNSRRKRRMRLLTAVSVLGLVGSVLALVATPVSASPSTSAARHASPVVHIPGHGSRPVHHPRSAVPDVNTSASFQIFNWNSGLCLGIYQGHHDAPALQWGCNGNPDQSWHWGNPDFPGSAWYQLVNGDGQCLGVAGGSLSEGARVVGWDCLGPNHPDQYWTPDGNQTGLCGAYSYLDNGNSTGYVLGVGGNSTAWGAPVVQWEPQGVCNNQFWYGPAVNYP
jgi:hypothetical protein